MRKMIAANYQGKMSDTVWFDNGIFRYHHYRNHRLVDKASLLEFSNSEARSLLTNEAVFGKLYVENGVVVGFCLCLPQPWDSSHFAMKMASLKVCLAPSLVQCDSEALVAAVCADASEAGFEHLSVHVDADDYAAFNGLVANGFQLMDAKRTFVSRFDDGADPHVRNLYEPREYRESDRDGVISLIGNAGFESRFTRDPEIPDEKARLLYVKWAERILDSDENRRLLYVVERKGKIVAASGGFEVAVAAGNSNKTILADGIFACLPSASGAYPTMMRKFIVEGRERGYALVETKVSMNNRSANRVLSYIGGDAVTCHYVLHKCLRR